MVGGGRGRGGVSGFVKRRESAGAIEDQSPTDPEDGKRGTDWVNSDKKIDSPEN